MSEHPDPHLWPEHTAASLLAGLAATRKADEAERFARLLDKKVRVVNACACGDCYHPVIGPNTDGEPCDWCRDCGCPSADHSRMTRSAA